MPDAAIGSPERVAANVVTSENLTDFTAKRLDLAPAPAPVEEKPEVEKEETKLAEIDKTAEETKAKEEAKQPPGRPPAGKVWFKGQWTDKHDINYRFSVASEEAKTHKAAAENAEKARQKAEAEAKALRAKLPPPPEPKELTEPQRGQYATEDEYQAARVDYLVEKKWADRQKTEAEARALEEHNRRVQGYSERLAKVKADVPDYDERIEAQKSLLIAPHIRDAILESESGPLIALHFADHPDEALRLNRLSMGAAMREFGKIEAMIETDSKPKAAAKTEAKTTLAEISNAPPPITPIRGTAPAGDVKVDTDGRFTGTYAEFKALRKAGKLK